MNRKEFLDYAVDLCSGDNLEGFYESIDEHNGEVARFGDSGPGTAVRLHAFAAQLRKVDAQYQRLTGNASMLPARGFGIRYPQ
jgi:hypothetical protein